MREIKFRAWIQNYIDPEDVGKMHYWNKDFFSNMSSITNYNSEFPDFREDIILMQYTEFKDINNKEIYDGDIIKFKNNYPYKSECVIAWINDGWAITRNNEYLCNLYSCLHNYNCKVIGNIYE